MGGGYVRSYPVIAKILLGQRFGTSPLSKMHNYGADIVKEYKDFLLNVELSPKTSGKAMCAEWRFYKFLLRNNIFKFYPKAARILRNILWIFRIRIR